MYCKDDMNHRQPEKTEASLIFLLDSNLCHLQCSWNLTLWIHPPVTYCSLCCWLHHIVWLPEDLIYTVATQLNMTGILILLHLFCTTLPRRLMLAIRNLNFTLSVVEMQHICDIILGLFLSPDDFTFHLTHTTHPIPGYLFYDDDYADYSSTSEH